MGPGIRDQGPRARDGGDNGVPYVECLMCSFHLTCRGAKPGARDQGLGPMSNAHFQFLCFLDFSLG